MNTIKRILVFSILYLFILQVNGQEYGWVVFTDKKNTVFNPFDYFHPLAIERRIINEVDLYDITDYPVNTEYCNSIENVVDSVMGVSRWFNAIFVKTDNNQISKILQMPFVKEFVPYQVSTFLTRDDTPNSYYEELQKNQVNSLQGDKFHSAGITGKGIRIAVFDGGFPSVDKHEVFEHVRSNNRIIKTWDFTQKKEFVYSFQNHGTNVLSCITGIYKEKPLGLATEAEFLLARTEVVPEPFSEEKNWMMAAEWADKNGAHIINSSLGYTHNRYFPHQMDGKYTFVTRAANMAARKGILVVNAAGNEGSGKWRIVGAPADADSVLSIGGINPDTEYHTDFSSYGPTADKRLKPNVSAYGHVYAATKNGMNLTQGTSFASPLVAGFAACALQTRPGIKNMDLFKEIEKSASLYPYFDYAHGYGVPQADYFLNKEKKEQTPTDFSVEVNGFELKIKALNIYPENSGKRNYLYFHFQNAKGFIERYGVVLVSNEDAFQLLDMSRYIGTTLRVHYHGQTLEIPIK